MIIVITTVLVVTYAILAGDVALLGEAGHSWAYMAANGIVTPCGPLPRRSPCWPPDRRTSRKKWLPWHTYQADTLWEAALSLRGLQGLAVGAQEQHGGPAVEM